MTRIRRHFVNFLDMLRQRKAKDKRIQQKNCTENEEKPSNCIICLDAVSCRGRLSVCKHWFCFHCIFEWSKNTNTCPICKARFRCITKVHLNTLKSPPRKVRVQDKDQCVWNEEDDIVADDYLDLSDNPESDDFDDDYEPSVHVTNPWTRRNNRGISTEGLDEYDLDDTFINDDVILLQDDGDYESSDSESSDNEGGDNECSDIESSDNESSDIEEHKLPRESPYLLRGSHAAANISLTDSILGLASVDSPNGGVSSPASTGNFVVSEDHLSDLNTDQWMLPGQHAQNSRRNTRSEQLKGHKKQTRRGRTQTTNAARKMPKSQRNQVSTRSKRKADDDASDEGDRSDGWINMNTRRENMRTLRSLPPSRKRKANQRPARHVPSDSEQTDDMPSDPVRETDSSRPKRTGSRNPLRSSSNLHLEAHSSAPAHSKRQSSKRKTIISSGESGESDSDYSMPTKNTRLKGKGKGKCLGNETLSSRKLCSRLTSKTLIISSDDSDDSAGFVAKSCTELRSRGSSCQGKVGNSGQQDSGSDDALERSEKAGSIKAGTVTMKSVGCKDWNKENEGCTTRQGRTCDSTSDEDCIAPTPQLHRYHSVFTKRRHRSPTYTFKDSENSDAKGRKNGGKSSKLAKDANNALRATNVQANLKQDDSPIVQVKTFKKRRRMVNFDSD